MEHKILQDQTPMERIRVLKDMAEKVEEFTYPKQLDDRQMGAVKDEFTKTAIQMARMNEEKKQFMDEFRNRMKPVKMTMESVLNTIRNKHEEITENVYLIKDTDTGKMAYYNAAGELVHHRPLRDEENQYSITEQIRKVN